MRQRSLEVRVSRARDEAEEKEQEEAKKKAE